MSYIVKFEQEEQSGRDCEVCGVSIPKARLDVLPHTTTCVNCSKEKSKVGVMIDTAGNNTGLEIQVGDPDNEYMQQALKR